jgi:hypothetical protein
MERGLDNESQSGSLPYNILPVDCAPVWDHHGRTSVLDLRHELRGKQQYAIQLDEILELALDRYIPRCQGCR